jgi:hypothetical protein
MTRIDASRTPARRRLGIAPALVALAIVATAGCRHGGTD